MRTYNGIERPDFTPDYITELKADEVFVFGSNLAGMHGGGAAYVAFRQFGAVMGCGVGLRGQSYAIPTMQGGVETVEHYVTEFIAFAKTHPDLGQRKKWVKLRLPAYLFTVTDTFGGGQCGLGRRGPLEPLFGPEQRRNRYFWPKTVSPWARTQQDNAGSHLRRQNGSSLAPTYQPYPGQDGERESADDEERKERVHGTTFSRPDSVHMLDVARNGVEEFFNLVGIRPFH